MAVDGRVLAEKMKKYYREETAKARDKWLAETRTTPFDPIKRALEENDKRIARLEESIRNKTWESKMSRLSKDKWLAQINDEAAARFASAVATKGTAKYEEKADKLAAVLAQASAEARAIKVKTIDDALKRVEIVVKRLHGVKGQI
ncbi:MAG: hypothetical protein RMI04_09435 [Thermofilaceae archaeon]|nr:hypothetical protein [Thermofilaceae archaeon]